MPLHLPPLRARGDDIILLAKRFLVTYAKEDNKDFSDFSPDVLNILKYYPWPGNVRQLQNVIRNIVVLHNNKTVNQKHLPAPLDTLSVSNHQSHNIHNTNTAVPYSTTDNEAKTATMDIQPQHVASTQSHSHTPQYTSVNIEPLALVERRAIEKAIEFCNGNIPKAAALLDVSPSTIYRKKQAWG